MPMREKMQSLRKKLTNALEQGEDLDFFQEKFKGNS